MEANLNTTNTLLAILAGAAVLQVLLFVGAAIMGYRLYRSAMQTVRELEERQVAPLVARTQALLSSAETILASVRDVTARLNRQTERVDHAIGDTVHRVDETAERVRASVASRIQQIVGLAHGVRAVVQSFWQGSKAA